MGNMNAADQRHRCRALVLSGGGFFGAFQAGAHGAMGEFDLVVGASAGALNGYAIASGMPPEELQSLWLRAATSARPGLHFPRYWGDGLLDVSVLEAMVHTLVRDWRPRVPFGVVVSQGWRARQVLIENSAITAQVLLASCAVPFLLPAKYIDGQLSFDGGLRDACPLWAAHAMGATESVAVNVWTHLPAWWPGQRRRATRHLEKGVTMVEPQAALGPLRASALASPETVQSWIALGRQTAEAVFARQ
jgi:NTE family protein